MNDEDIGEPCDHCLAARVHFPGFGSDHPQRAFYPFRLRSCPRVDRDHFGQQRDQLLCCRVIKLLNHALAAGDPASGVTEPVWARYLKDWTFWNHLRTISSTAASALYIASITAK